MTKHLKLDSLLQEKVLTTMAPQDKGASKAVYLTRNLPVPSFNPSKISLRTALGPRLGKIPEIPRATIVNRNTVKGKAMNSNWIAENAASP